ncbi:hypothetical protein OUZ56_015999 [Daphnia magna]|uniref:Uncharacterized protein n=1 Tax=Daphnia magna TaxID=35525 RepID=A0ABR0APD3_9CRUS|nr:hypothetical protein OUZ56_015999 [Daphnia magna]
MVDSSLPPLLPPSYRRLIEIRNNNTGEKDISKRNYYENKLLILDYTTTCQQLYIYANLPRIL